MSYEEVQRRILKLWEEVQSEEEILGGNEEELDDTESEVEAENCDLDVDSVFEQSASDYSDDDDELDDIPLATRFLSYIGRDAETKWNKMPPRARRAPAHNVVTAKPGVIREAANIKTILSCWHFSLPKI